MLNKKVTKWEPDNFKLHTNTLWSFPDSGNWATHNSLNEEVTDLLIFLKIYFLDTPKKGN